LSQKWFKISNLPSRNLPKSLVRKYGVRLMPELYAHLNPMPFEAAAEMEKDLAGDLRHEGYTVAGGT
jgi:hypothetical protein